MQIEPDGCEEVLAVRVAESYFTPLPRPKPTQENPVARPCRFNPPTGRSGAVYPSPWPDGSYPGHDLG